MKRIIPFLIFLSLGFTSCLQQKLDSQTAALAQTWQVAKKEIDGSSDIDNFKAVFSDYSIHFSEDGNYNESYISGGNAFAISGTWLFQNNGNELKLIDNNQTRNYNIVDLNAAILTLELLGSPKEEVYFLEPY